MMSPPKPFSMREGFLPTLSLFTSFGTLLCCALPALLVTLGAGATLAGIVGEAPWLVSLSHYKLWTFGISGALLLLSIGLRWRSRNAPCPIDAAQARACTRLRRISGVILAAAIVIWLIGFFFAFLAVRIFY